MTRRIALIVSFLALAGCGVDGEPTRPTVAADVAVTSSGTYTNVGLGVSNGWFSVFLGR